MSLRHQEEILEDGAIAAGRTHTRSGGEYWKLCYNTKELLDAPEQDVDWTITNADDLAAKLLAKVENPDDRLEYLHYNSTNSATEITDEEYDDLENSETFEKVYKKRFCWVRTISLLKQPHQKTELAEGGDWEENPQLEKELIAKSERILVELCKTGQTVMNYDVECDQETILRLAKRGIYNVSYRHWKYDPVNAKKKIESIKKKQLSTPKHISQVAQELIKKHSLGKIDLCGTVDDRKGTRDNVFEELLFAVHHVNLLHGENAHRRSPVWQKFIKQWRESVQKTRDDFSKWVDREAKVPPPKGKPLGCPKRGSLLGLFK